jgi:hypothetical protein
MCECQKPDEKQSPRSNCELAVVDGAAKGAALGGAVGTVLTGAAIFATGGVALIPYVIGGALIGAAAAAKSDHCQK